MDQQKSRFPTKTFAVYYKKLLGTYSTDSVSVEQTLKQISDVQHVKLADLEYEFLVDKPAPAPAITIQDFPIDKIKQIDQLNVVVVGDAANFRKWSNSKFACIYETKDISKNASLESFSYWAFSATADPIIREKVRSWTNSFIFECLDAATKDGGYLVMRKESGTVTAWRYCQQPVFDLEYPDDALTIWRHTSCVWEIVGKMFGYLEFIQRVKAELGSSHVNVFQDHAIFNGHYNVDNFRAALRNIK